MLARISKLGQDSPSEILHYRVTARDQFVELKAVLEAELMGRVDGRALAGRASAGRASAGRAGKREILNNHELPETEAWFSSPALPSKPKMLDKILKVSSSTQQRADKIIRNDQGRLERNIRTQRGK